VSAEGAGAGNPASQVEPPEDTGSAHELRLIESARNGDTDAFAALVCHHQDNVYGLIVRMVRNRTAAEELTQDVFMKVYRNLARFRGEARFSTWLFRIAVNTCQDFATSRTQRNRRREIHLEDEALATFDPPSSAATPDADVEFREMGRTFEHALDRLEPIYRAPFLLRHQEGLGYAEIAAALDITTSNAKVRVHRAREMVLGDLRAAGYDV
jgi:RNA polymerase sigma-70 factor (ECF subfamily)